MKKKNEKGITLIALVITIIILLILAGISIATLTGENGILTKASTAKEESNKAGAKEKVQLAVMSYQIDKKTTTLYDELIKIEGLTYITPDNRNDGPKYNVIVDGYEFVINEDLSIEYVGESKNQIIPEITKVEYETVEVEKLTITITAKTEDKAGLKEIRVSYKRIEDGKTEYETVKVEKVTGKEISIEVEIPINGEYVIEAVGENNQIGKKEISINNIKEGNILATITAGEVTDKATANLTIRAQSQGITIQAIELYVSDIKVKTYQYKDLETIKEETYTLNNLEFYEQNNCYIKAISSQGTEVVSELESVKNSKYILNLTDLKNLATQVNDGTTFQDKTIYLMADITTENNWIPIGYWDGTEGQWTGKYFSGIFEGNNNSITISSLSKDTTYKNSGLFGMGIGCTINNLTVNGIIDAQTIMVGGIIGAVKNGRIYNCTNNSNNTNSISYNQMGGIAGHIENSQIINCTNTGTIYGNSIVGGICGYAYSETTISNCTNSGLIKCYGVSNEIVGNWNGSSGLIGGICAKIDNSRIENCTNIGEVTGNESAISPKGLFAGGIAGLSNGSTVATSKNKEIIHYDIISEIKVQTWIGIGGIVGGAINGSIIEQCFNTHDVKSDYNGNYRADSVGGIAGYINISTIKNAYNTGSIYGNNKVGGIVGYSTCEAGFTGNSYLYNNYNASENIKGNASIGNYVGYATSTIGMYHSWIKELYGGESGNGCEFTSYAEYTLEQMKTSGSGLLTLLINGEGAGLWKQEAGKNGGLPYLVNNQP